MIAPDAPRSDDALVTLVVEQLRRRVPGGIGTYVRELVRAVVGCGGDIASEMLLYASRPTVSPDPLATLGAAISTSLLPAAAMTRAWDIGVAGPPLRSTVVHAPSLLVPPTRAHLVVTVHDLAFRVVPETFTAHGRRWHERAIRRVARMAEHIVVPSEPVAAQLVEAGLDIDRRRVRVIPEGADHLAPMDEPATKALLESLGVDGPFVLCVGTIEPRKNLARLISAFSSVRARFSERLWLVVCGPSGWMADLEPCDDVVFSGHVPDRVLSGLYAQARVVAYVPLYEGFGLPALEAMHAGAVVVTSNVPAAQQGTLVVDPYDIDAIADGLERGAFDASLRDELRRSGLLHAAQHSWAKTANAHIALWREVARR